jgi:hypothetical protein
MGVVWKEEGTPAQRAAIEDIFFDSRRREEQSPRVLIFRRTVSGPRAAREVNPRPHHLMLVVRAEKSLDRWRADLVTPGGQVFPYAVDDDLAAELDELA